LLNDFEMGGGMVTGAVGFNFADREFEVDGEEAFIPLNEQSRWGVFGLGRYSVNAWIFEASGRVDNQKNETSNLIFEGGNYDNSETTFSAALTGIYQMGEVSTIGLNLARSERA
ncbi:MAG: hypothetical protein VW016_07495, partial [Luminiphilus sp.]